MGACASTISVSSKECGYSESSKECDHSDILAQYNSADGDLSSPLVQDTVYVTTSPPNIVFALINGETVSSPIGGGNSNVPAKSPVEIGFHKVSATGSHNGPAEVAKPRMYYNNKGEKLDALSYLREVSKTANAGEFHVPCEIGVVYEGVHDGQKVVFKMVSRDGKKRFVSTCDGKNVHESRGRPIEFGFMEWRVNV